VFSALDRGIIDTQDKSAPEVGQQPRGDTGSTTGGLLARHRLRGAASSADAERHSVKRFDN